jgi:nucleoside-diphosphate-sugar epimerase
MRLAVTGVTGFIGSNLARMLVAEGHEVTATGRAVTPTETRRLSELQQAGVQVHAGNLLDAGFAAQVVQGAEAVIHLAAAQHEGNVPDSYFHDVNVGGIQRLLDAAIGAGVRRFVYGSTIGVYGSAMNGELDEESTPRPENAYARTKLEAESVVEGLASRIETSIVRISETYGPGDFRLLKLFKGIDRGAFVMLGSGENLRQVIYVDDLNRALLKAVDSPAALGQTFVLCGSEVMTTNQMVQAIARAVGRKRDPMRVPVWPFRAAAAVLEATLKPLGIQPPLTQRRLDFFTKSFIFSTRKTREVLGFEPQVTFADGAARTAAWYRKAGYL